MPNRNRNAKHNTRTQKKRRGRKGNRNPTARRSTVVSDLRGATPIFPASKRVKLWYFENELSFTTASGVPGGYVFSANGAYDTNITGTGHQPIGFDQMMTFYNQCTVVNSKISVDFYNPNNAGLPIRCNVYLSPSGTILTGISQLMENGEIVTGFAQSTVVMDRVLRLSLDCHVPAYFGRDEGKTFLNDDDMFCTAAANPIEQVYFVISAFDTFTSSASQSIYFNVTMEFDVVFWEPRKVTIS